MAPILHVDLDAFYASVEQVRRPQLRGKPIAVGGGVVLAASYEARKYGVRSAMPLGEARRRCPRLIVVDGSFGDYVELSDRVFDICRSYTPLVEQISIDEAFLDVSGATHLFGSPAIIAGRIRHDVRSQTGLAISAGVARTKFLAKIGSRVAKPNGLVVIDPSTELEFLHALPVRLIWGVGPVTAARLAELGIATVGELANTPRASLSARLGRGAGHHLHALAWNRDPRPVVTKRRAGSVGAQSAFGRDERDPAVYRRVLARLADRVGARLRKKQRAGRTITLRVRFSDLQVITRATTLGAATASTEALYRVGVHLAESEIPEAAAGRGVGLLGLRVSNLVRSPHLQLELPLVDPHHDRADRSGTERALASARLDHAIDGLRNRFGKQMIGRASTLLDPRRPSTPIEFGDLAIPVEERHDDE
jgi:DNA polymerase-4